MNLFVRIILWGLLLLMLEKVDAQSRSVEKEHVVTAETSH
jgi:hypothetical protein